MDSKIKHMEMIQLKIIRAEHYSFLIRLYSAILLSAIFILAVPRILGCIPLLVLWFWDGFYVSRKQALEKLYERIRTQEDQETNFMLNATLYEKAEGSLWKTCWSRWLGWYYGGLFVLLVVLTALRHGYSPRSFMLD